MRSLHLRLAAVLAYGAAACGLSVAGAIVPPAGEEADASAERVAPSLPPGESEDGGASNDGRAPDGSNPGDDASTKPDAKVDAGPVACPEIQAGGVKYENHCYFVLEQNMTANAASAACAARGAHLLTITSTGENDVAKSVSSGVWRWIGLRQSGTTNDKSEFKWVTGETPVPDFWAVGQPNESARCVGMEPDGEWADRTCGTELPAFCERE